jgi:tRNA modification GTPase
LGRHLVRPFRVVLAGRPNVGKSSLVNRLLGYGRSITSPMPGTTRDVVTATTALDGWPVELADTAGLHAAGSELESQGIQLAMAQIRGADLVVFVHDASASVDIDCQPAALPGDCTASDAISVLNKADLVPLGERKEPLERYVSAVTGEGLDRLAGELGRRLTGDVPPQESGVPFLERHVRAIQQARQLLAAGASKSAEDWLAVLLA